MNELVSEKDLEKLKDYDRLKREYTLLHEDYRRLLGRHKKQLAIQGVLHSKNEWTDVTKQEPCCYEEGNWDGKRSDWILVQDSKGVINFVRCYSGYLDGSSFLDFYDKHDNEIEDVCYFKEVDR